MEEASGSILEALVDRPRLADDDDDDDDDGPAPHVWLALLLLVKVLEQHEAALVAWRPLIWSSDRLAAVLTAVPATDDILAVSDGWGWDVGGRCWSEPTAAIQNLFERSEASGDRPTTARPN